MVHFDEVKQNATFDSSFWINAHRSGLLSYVLARYRLHFVPAVAGELKEEFRSGREFWGLVRADAIQATTPSLQQTQEYGAGERDAINVALEHRDWVLLIDDRRPLLAATELGLSVLCTPVLTADLYREGKMNGRQALEILARLTAMNTVGPDLLATALAQLGRVWAGR